MADVIDIDGDTLNIVAVGTPANGRIERNSEGRYVYMPKADFYGADRFTFDISDGTTTVRAQMSLTVNPVNDAPVANDFAITLAEDNNLRIDLLAQTHDVDSATLTADIVTGPAHGSLIANADGTYTYTPSANFNGPDRLTYKVTDGTLELAIATVEIGVTAVNDAAEATNDAISLAEDNSARIDVLVNDRDIDEDPLTTNVVSGPVHGTLVHNGDGTFSYTPDHNFFGSDSFTYRANDGQADSGLATVAITVTAVNDAAEAIDDLITIAEDAAIRIDVLANDADVEGDALTATVVTGPTHGTLVRNTDGTFTYTANRDYFGADSFTYKANDGQVDSNLATVNITVTPVNDKPEAANLVLTSLEDTALRINLLAGAHDVDSTTLSVGIVGTPTHGALVANADGTFTYVPTLNFNGADRFTYRVSDGELESDLATVDITVTAVNDAPDATADAVTVAEDNMIRINVLANDLDVDGDPLTAIVAQGPANGMLVKNADGSFSYTPKADFFGVDRFTYRANDGSLDSALTEVTITVTPVNDAPVAVDDAATTAEDTAVRIAVLGNDRDVDSTTLTTVIVTGPAHGSLIANADGSYSYTPNANYNGADRFTYKVSDGTLESAIATVNVGVTAVNDTPEANNDVITLAEDNVARIDVLANDRDVDGNSLTANVVTGPAHGALVRNPDGTYTYTPNLDYFGADSFTYKANDGQVDSNLATVNITVTAVNDAPIATNDAITTNEDTAVRVAVLANDRDVDSATLTTTLVTGPAYGTVVMNGDGSFTYTANANYNGTDSFSYRVSDGALSSNIAQVAITINAVNDAPVAVSSTVTSTEDTPYLFKWNDFNVSDVDDISLSIVIATLPADGLVQYLSGTAWVAVTVNQIVSKTDLDAGKLRFIPDANESGNDGFATAGLGNLKQTYAQFNYKASDGRLTSNVATLSVKLIPVADAPTLTIATSTTNTGRELFRTGWESAANPDKLSTLVNQSQLEGWTLITGPDSFSDASGAGQNGFEIWTTGDTQADPTNTLRTVSAMAGDGANWLELNNSASTLAQTLGIQRSVTTVAGATYTLDFDYAGRGGYSADYTRIGVYVDGVKLTTYANTSPVTGLNWQALQFSFVGNGTAQTIKLVTEATAFNAGGRGAMIDDIALTEQLPANTGNEDSAIRLATISASLTDTDGSETLKLAIQAIPVGATLSDGTRNFVSTTGNTTADITAWTLGNLSILPPANYNGSFDLTVVASATETSTGVSATTSKTLKVNVLPVADAVVAQASNVTGIEDTAYVFKLADFKLSNPDAIGIASVVSLK